VPAQSSSSRSSTLELAIHLPGHHRQNNNNVPITSIVTAGKIIRISPIISRRRLLPVVNKCKSSDTSETSRHPGFSAEDQFISQHTFKSPPDFCATPLAGFVLQRAPDLQPVHAELAKPNSPPAAPPGRHSPARPRIPHPITQVRVLLNLARLINPTLPRKVSSSD